MTGRIESRAIERRSVKSETQKINFTAIKKPHFCVLHTLFFFPIFVAKIKTIWKKDTGGETRKRYARCHQRVGLQIGNFVCV